MLRYVTSENYPAAAPAGMCMYDLNKCDSNICQFRYVHFFQCCFCFSDFWVHIEFFLVCTSVIWKVLMSFLFLLRLEFEDVEMGGPEMGACQNDTMMVRKCEGNICNIDNNGYTKWRKYLQPNDEIKGPLQNSSIPGQRNGPSLCESGAWHSLWNPHRPTQWATSCTISYKTASSLRSSLILSSDLDGEGPISAGSQAHLQPCFRISKVESKGESRPSWILFRWKGGRWCWICIL